MRTWNSESNIGNAKKRDIRLNSLIPGEIGSLGISPKLSTSLLDSSTKIEFFFRSEYVRIIRICVGN